MDRAWVVRVRAATWKTPGSPSPGNLIQIGDHEQQALGGGKGGGQRAGGQGTMDRACGAGLGLHFHDIDAVSKNISTVLVGPFVHMLRHGRGGRDGVNGSDFCKRIRHVAGGRVGRPILLKGLVSLISLRLLSVLPWHEPEHR